MITQKDIFKGVEPSKFFSAVDTYKIAAPFENYVSCLDDFFSEYAIDSNPSFMRFIENFSLDYLDEEEVRFVFNSLKFTNYDESALRGESVVIFSEPVIVSQLKCTSVSDDDREGAVRLISFKDIDKKFETQKSVKSDPFNKNKSFASYSINDVVWGLILPRRTSLKFVKAVSYLSLHSDYKKMERTQKALQLASEIPRIEIQKIIKKFEEINFIIKERKEAFDTIQGDIQALVQERSHAESSLDNSKAALEKVRSDLDRAGEDFKILVSSIAAENDKLEAAQAKVKVEASFFKKEQERLKALQIEVGEASESLTAIRTELADAKREKNLTNFDTLGHSAETGRQLVAYYIFAAATFLGLMCMAVYIYWTSQNFSDSFPYLLSISGWNILLSRLPLVAATTLIIGGLSGVFFYLIKHIVSLNTEKMTMLKAGILAEQITNSLDCKDMDDQERLDFQRNTKIKLIMQVFSKSEPDINQSNVIIEALKALNSK